MNDHFNFLCTSQSVSSDLEIKNGLVILVNKSNIYDEPLPCTNAILMLTWYYMPVWCLQVSRVYIYD